ncbi:alpha/beta fold hydrolase [Nevskia ramosa]|uniref:alpha/beta fold hydrolase n=1 Tax=Nevskia ramosa TaxID=64002 RepID=UPI0003B4DF04|nr:alpha/beta hydrolase [Nevskia ramosa]
MLILKAFLLLLALTIAVYIGLYFLAPKKIADTAMSLERMRAGLQRSEMDIDAKEGNLHIVYLEGGPANAPPLLLLHGIGADKDNWTRVAATLTKRYRVYAIDLPGFGESSKPADARYRISDQVERVALVVSKLGLTRFHLGGNSMGGWISAAYAIAHPEAVQSLWLLDPAGMMSAEDSEMSKLLAAGMPPPLFARSAQDFGRLMQFVMQKPPFIPAPVRQVLIDRQIANYALNEHIFGEIREQSGALDATLAEMNPPLATPTLIVWGDKDRVLHPSGAAILHRLLPNSKVLMMAGIGHLPMLEAPGRAAQDYLAFRAGLGD